MRCAALETFAPVSRLLAGLLCLSLSGGASAALQGRDVDGVATNGFEAYFDTVLNITWLADANFAQTSGLTPDGQLTWVAANEWAQSLTHLGASDWRLPSFKPVNGVAVTAIPSTFDGSTDASYNITSSANELAYMYYVNLGLLASVSPDFQLRTTFGVPDGDGVAIPGLAGGRILNLQKGLYWTQVEFGANDDGRDRAWGLWTKGAFAGYHGPEDKLALQFAWAVHDGDPFKVDEIAPTPTVDEPSTAWLILAGLGIGGYITRGRKLSGAKQHCVA